MSELLCTEWSKANHSSWPLFTEQNFDAPTGEERLKWNNRDTTAEMIVLDINFLEV